MILEIQDILKELLPRYYTVIMHSKCLVIYSQEKTWRDNRFGAVVITTDPKGDDFGRPVLGYDFVYQIEDPSFSFENLACDLILAELFYFEEKIHSHFYLVF